MSRKLSERGELAIVESIRKAFPASNPDILRGIGDDAAVVRRRNRASVLLTVDLLIEGVHFDLRFIRPGELGFKALAVNVSDIAAMGGVPRYALLALGLPGKLTEDFLREFLRGFSRASRKFGTDLIGGDTCGAPRVCISVTIWGESAPGGWVGRERARPGDGLFVSGYPGMSALGLAVLKRKGSRPKSDRRWIRKHLLPEPRLALGRELARKKLASAMIDCSDGIVLDLGRLSRDSRVGIEIDADAVSFPPGFASRARALGRDPIELALGGGEDYELLFTSPPGKWDQVKRLARRLRIPVQKIGVVKRKPGAVTLRRGGTLQALPARSGYEHFRSER